MIPFNHIGCLFKYFGSAIYPQAVLEDLDKSLKSLKNHASLLDIGAGTGVLSELAYRCRDDLHFVAIDPAEGMLKFSPKYMQTHKACAEALPFEDESFEVVIIGEALHHFSDPHKAIQEIVRVLKKEGKLFIYEFDPNTFRGKSICTIEKILGEPGHFYTPKVLKKMLEGHGFCVDINQHAWRYTVDAYLENKRLEK